MDTQVQATLQRIAVEADKAKKQALKDETALALGDHFYRNPGDYDELAYSIVNNSFGDKVNTDIIGQIIETKSVGLGDYDFYGEELRGLRARWQGVGGKIHSYVIRDERNVMPREEIVFSLDYHIDKVRTNFWGTLASLLEQGRDKVAAEPVNRLVELVRGSITAGPYYGSYALSTLTSDQIDVIADAVAARSGGNATIVGTRTALRGLSKIGLEYGDNIAEQIFRVGVIGQYKGFNVVAVENFEDENGYFVLPDDEIWIVGRKAGRLTYYGDGLDVRTLQRNSFKDRTEVRRVAGMALFGVEKGRLGRVKFS